MSVGRKLLPNQGRKSPVESNPEMMREMKESGPKQNVPGTNQLWRLFALSA